MRDRAGISMGEALTAFGLDPARIGEAARRPEDLVGYLEVHIEQGPELLDAGLPLGVVSSIASARRFALEVTGRAAHAGGTPYARRRDALVGAAELVVAIEAIAKETGTIATVGRIRAFPGGVNVVPGLARLSLDLRAEHDAERDAAFARIEAAAERICAARGLGWRAEEIYRADAVACDPALSAAIAAGIRATTGAEPAAPLQPRRPRRDGGRGRDRHRDAVRALRQRRHQPLARGDRRRRRRRPRPRCVRVGGARGRGGSAVTPTLPELIDAAYPVLAPQERRVADLLRTRPELGLLATSSELARTSGVSKATVSRLLRRLGFEDARAARAALREQRAAGVPVPAPTPGDPVAAHLEQDVANLRTALAGIEAAGLSAAAQAVADAGQVLVLGHRSGRPIAALLASALQQARPGVRLVPEAGQTLAEHLVDLAERDVVVMVDLRRRSHRGRAGARRGRRVAGRGAAARGSLRPARRRAAVALRPAGRQPVRLRLVRGGRAPSSACSPARCSSGSATRVPTG